MADDDSPSPCFSLDTLVSLSLDFGVTLDEDPSEGRVAKLLSSSRQATSTAATNRIIRKRPKALNAPPNKHMKYTFKTMISAFLLQKMYSGVLGGYP